MRLMTLLLGLVGLFWVGTAQAHKASDAFIYIDADRASLRIDLALRDLALLLPLDANGDNQLTGAEVRAQRGALANTIDGALAVTHAGAACRLQGQAWGISQHSDGAYLASQYSIHCDQDSAPDRMAYDLLFDQDSLHRGLVQISSGGATRLAVLSPEQRYLRLDSAMTAGAWQTFTAFLVEGIDHLLIGLDHLLFLLVLVLPATLPNGGLATRPVTDSSPRQRLMKLAGVVTAFTVAHSITLVLAALDIVTLPIAWVETVIALSIAIAAVNVAWPILGRKTWKLAFAFGLVHGFGFASVLADLTSGVSGLAAALAGFNLGVELGQLGLLVLGFPLLLWLARHQRLYQRVLVPLTLVGVIGISLVWVVQRIPAF